jgi:plasmid stabilization system protein ParE
MRLVVLPEAADEFDDAVDYYDQQQAGLGHRLRDEVDRHIRWIFEHSAIPRIRPGGYRRVNLKVFPYCIAYIVQGDTIWILAIAHSHRKPQYWIRRRLDGSQPSE